MGARLTNLKNMSPRTRMVMFVTLIVLFFSAVYAANKFLTNPDDGGLPAKAVVAKPKVAKNKPGDESKSIELQKAKEKDIRENEQKARKQGQAYIEPISQLSPIDDGKGNQNAETQRINRVVAPQRIVNFNRTKQKKVDKNELKRLESIVKRKGAAINQLIGNLDQSEVEQKVTIVSKNSATNKKASLNKNLQDLESAANVSSSKTALFSPDKTITPGRIFPAVLEVGINTDEISPVVATIQGGPLHGARVVGQPKLIGGTTGFIRDGKALVEFTSISWNGNFSPVRAVALDADTSRTALADDVDDHTLYRYATLIGSFLLGGFGQALQDSGRTVVTAGDGVVATATPDKDDTRLLKEALGNLGKGLEPIAKAEFNKPPTVKVFPGAVIGVLFVEPVQAAWIPPNVEFSTY